MKQVTIDTVRERINAIASRGNSEYGIGLTLKEEFELACLRQLAASLEAKPVVYSLIFRNMEGKLHDYINVNTTFATMEEAQAYGKGGRYVTQGDGSIKWVADPSLDPVVVPLYTAPPVQVTSVDDDVRSVVSLLENNEWAEHCTKTEIGQRLESEITRLVGQEHPWPVGQQQIGGPGGVHAKFDHHHHVGAGDGLYGRAGDDLSSCGRGCGSGGAGYDNTAQQFEALSSIGKSEHLLNAERIAREAQALSDQLNATSAVHHRVSGWSERQQKVISYSLWRFMHSAYEMARDAAQKGTKEDFDRFMQDAKCAEEIREEFTSAWSGKP